MKKSAQDGIIRALFALRNAETKDLLSFHHGYAVGQINGAFSVQDDLDVKAWDRCSKLADNAWRNRLQELCA